MTVKEEYMKYVHECESLVQNGGNTFPDISGGMIKYIRLSKMLNYDKYLLNCAYEWGIYVFIYGKRNQKTLERGKNKINEADDLSSSGNDKR